MNISHCINNQETSVCRGFFAATWLFRDYADSSRINIKGILSISSAASDPRVLCSFARVCRQGHCRLHCHTYGPELTRNTRKTLSFHLLLVFLILTGVFTFLRHGVVTDGMESCPDFWTECFTTLSYQHWCCAALKINQAAANLLSQGNDILIWPFSAAVRYQSFGCDITVV